MKYLYILPVLLCLTTQASVTNSIPCDFLSISNAIAAVGEGDEIDIQAGTCMMSNSIVHNRAVSFILRGAGTNLTTLVSTNLAQVFGFQKNSTNLLTISDLNCVGHIANSFGFFSVGANYPSAKMNGPTRFTRITMTNLIYRGFDVGQSDSWGLIDHCYFDTVAGAACEPFTFRGNDIISWTNAPPTGTNMWFAEDCYVNNHNNAGNGFFDAYDGAAFSVRYCFMSGNSPSGVHGYDSQYTSTRWFDINNNVFTNMNNVLGIEIRGGSGNIYSNRFYGGTDAIQLAYYRSCLIAHSIVTGIGLPGVTNIVDFGGIMPTNGQTIILGFNDEVYTMETSLTTLNKHVAIGASLAESLTNLGAALQLSGGAGTKYATGMTKNRQWVQSSISATQLKIFNCLDGNVDGTGWPANQQPGVVQAWPFGTNTQTLLPIYCWGNQKDGTNILTNLKDNSGVCSYNITNLIKLNRDYYDAVRPAYTPLQYPHPLNSEYYSATTPTYPIFSGSHNIKNTRFK